MGESAPPANGSAPALVLVEHLEDKRFDNGTVVHKFKAQDGKRVDVWDDTSHKFALAHLGESLPGTLASKQNGQYTNYSWIHPDQARKRGAGGRGGPSDKAVLLAPIYEQLVGATVRAWERMQAEPAKEGVDKPGLARWFELTRPATKEIAVALLADAMALVS